MSDSDVKIGMYTNANGEEVSFAFNSNPSMRDKITFVKSVSETIVGDSYLYIARDMFFDFFIITYFTNVDTSNFFNEENEDDQDSISMVEQMLAETNIAQIVKENMDYDVLMELEMAVDLDIEYRTGIHRSPIEYSLSSLLDTLDMKIGNFDTDSIMNVISKLSNISGEFTPDKMLEAYANNESFKKMVIGKDHSDVDG